MLAHTSLYSDWVGHDAFTAMLLLWILRVALALSFVIGLAISRRSWHTKPLKWQGCLRSIDFRTLWLREKDDYYLPYRVSRIAEPRTRVQRSLSNRSDEMRFLRAASEPLSVNGYE